MMVAAACSPSAVATTSSTSSATQTPVGELPPGCSPITLAAPTGEIVTLDGIWETDPSTGRPMTWWIRTQGTCIWGSGMVDDYTDDGPSANAFEVQAFNGLVSIDFFITGEIVALGPSRVAATGHARYSPLSMEIHVEEGAVTLREDRDPTAQGPRCPDPAFFCPPPLVLHPR